MKYGIILLLCVYLGQAQAQIKKNALFTFTCSKKAPKVGDVVDLVFTATIDKEWKLYATNNTLDPGPLPTEATFTPNDAYVLVGKLESVKPHSAYDAYWKGNVSYFVEKATFVQRVKLRKSQAVIEGKLKYQTCTLKDGSCALGRDKFQFTL